MAKPGRYYPLDKQGKEVLFPESTPPKGGSRYHEDTPTFESLAANAGQGIRGDKSYSRGQEEYKPRVGTTGEWKK